MIPPPIDETLNDSGNLNYDDIFNTTNITALPSWLAGPPPGPDHFKGQSVIPVAIVTGVVASLLVGLRFYTRAKILRAVHLDDWFILLSLVLGLGTSATMITQLSLGLGRHFFYVSDHFSDYLKSGLAASLFYTASLFSTKVSILCLYIRIFTYQGVQLLSKILLAIVVISHTWILASILTTCVPLDSIWIIEKRPSFCHSFNVFWANAGLNMATDLLIFLLPLPVIFNLRLPRRQKLSLYFVFLLALGVCVIAAVRLANLLKHDNPLHFFMDVTWSAVPIANLNCIEVHTAIICACLTTLKPLLVQMFPRLLCSRPPKSPMIYPLPRYDRPLTIGTQITRHYRPPRYSFVSSIHTSDFKFDAADEVGSHLQSPVFANQDGDGWSGDRNSYYLLDLERDGSIKNSGPSFSRPSSWPLQSPSLRAVSPERPLRSATSRSDLVEGRDGEKVIAIPELTHLREDRQSYEALQNSGYPKPNMHGWI